MTDTPLTEYNRGWVAGHDSALDACNPVIRECTAERDRLATENAALTFALSSLLAALDWDSRDPGKRAIVQGAKERARAALGAGAEEASPFRRRSGATIPPANPSLMGGIQHSRPKP